jgi:hypothetical protein
MLKTQDSTKAAKLEAKLQEVLWRLEELEAELDTLRENWGGSPLLVSLAQYEHDPVQFANVVRARSRYLWLQQEIRIHREIAYALMKKLREVRP